MGRLAILIGRRWATLESVKTATWRHLSHQHKSNEVPERKTNFRCLHVLQVHTDLAGDAISKPKIGCGNLRQKFTRTAACE